MKISKIREVKTPTRGTALSAGIDFYVPKGFTARLTPGTDILVPSGIRAEVPHGYALIAMNRSSVATSTDAMRRAGLTPKANIPKGTLVVGACVVDEDYQGEIHIHLINVGRSIEVIHPGMKVAQFVLTPVNYEGVEEVSDNELYNAESDRSDGGFGSTNER